MKKDTLNVSYDLAPTKVSGVHAGQIRMGGGFTVLVINTPFKGNENPFNTVILDIDYEETGLFDEDDLFQFNEQFPASAEEIIEDFPFVVNGHLTITNGDD